MEGEPEERGVEADDGDGDDPGAGRGPAGVGEFAHAGGGRWRIEFGGTVDVMVEAKRAKVNPAKSINKTKPNVEPG